MTRFGLFLVLLAACEIDVPLVHDLPKGQDAGGAGRSCQVNQDCGFSGLYCAKAPSGCGGLGLCERMQSLRRAGGLDHGL